MCGRYVSPDQAAIERAWQIHRSSGLDLPRRFNVQPTTAVPVLRLVDWNRPRVRRYNNADHRALHPADRFFEHVERQIEAAHRW